MGNKAVKTPLGMVSSYFFPFASEPVGTHPVYGEKVDMGAAVKGYLSLTTASGDITGDDAMLLYFEQFVSGQVDVETTLSDLEVNAKLYGHSYKAGRETAKGEDSAPNGAYAFIEPILKKDKTLVYRASFFYKTTAMLSAEKQEADTRKSDFNPKMNAVSLRVMKDNADAWRERQEFPTQSEAEAFIDSLAGGTAAYGVTISGSKHIPGMMPTSSTWMFAHNIYNLLAFLAKDGKIVLDRNDPIVVSSLTTINKEIVHAGAKEAGL